MHNRAVINGCTIDWFLPWPAQALTAVAKHYMSTFEIQDEQADTVREALISHMANVACAQLTTRAHSVSRSSSRMHDLRD